jgi:hypothetical protein
MLCVAMLTVIMLSVISPKSVLYDLSQGLSFFLVNAILLKKGIKRDKSLTENTARTSETLKTKNFLQM